MVVNSYNFLLFFVVVFVVYYLPVFRNNSKYQNIWLFLTSYFFYGFADWRMIPLLFVSTVVFFFVGKWLKTEMNLQNKEKASKITTIGVVLGVCILLYFKYLNFFAETFSIFLNAIGLRVTWTTLNIILPIGVSFFTFKLISYIIEIHREHIEPCKDFFEFGTYIAFFPTILSGPIDRPNKFIPQLHSVRLFHYDLAVDGFRQILWGMFTKMCVADNIAAMTDTIWATHSTQDGSTLIITALLYPVQMYADFDGYSNMAIGVSKILGVKVTRNFNHPFLARNIAEYWQKWHISLTGWLTDYVFSPLNISFRNLGNLGIILAIIINFVIIGFWHGANWTFGLFGLYHGLLYIPLIILGVFGKRKKLKSNSLGLPFMNDLYKMVITFILVSFGLILFHANDVADALNYIEGIISTSIFSMPDIQVKKAALAFTFLLLVLEWSQRDKEHPLQATSTTNTKKKLLQNVIDYVIIAALIFYGNFESNQFIYFQF